MTILITGGGGFLGAWVVKLLAEKGAEMRIFDRSEDRRIVRAIAGDVADTLDWRTGDVGETGDVMAASEGCDFTIHLAALLTPACAADPLLGARVNLLGTLNVFEAIKAHGGRGVAYASSAGIFGSDDGARPYPVTQYAAFKLACEGSARAYWHDAAIPSVGYRPTVVYGPGRERGLTAGPTLACREAVAGRAYTVGYSGAQDMVYVADVAADFVAAATRPFEGAHAFSLGGATETPAAVVSAIRAEIPAAEVRFEGPPVPMAATITPTSYDHLFGPRNRTPLASGIAQTIAHYRAAAAADVSA